MITPSSLTLWTVLALSPFAHALALNLIPVPSIATAPASGSNSSVVGAGNSNAHCTKDPTWLAPGFTKFSLYDFMCQDAMNAARRELASHGMDTEFEFLDRGAAAQTSKPQIQLPRKYVACE